METVIKSRIAPTPSGYLHVGNAYNFLVTWRETVHKRNGLLGLRIDDSDSTRVREEYIEDIFDSLEWLQIKWEFGPKDKTEFKNKYSQGLKRDKYKEFLETIPNTFICDCSRSELKETECTCEKKNLNFLPEQNAIKIKSEFGDITLWRKDDLPAYQLVSLYEDIFDEINFIVRGEDLLSSTKIQFFLSSLINDQHFSKAHFLHHPLLEDRGEKISKSQIQNDNHPLSLIQWRQDGKTRDDLINYYGFDSWEKFLDS